MIFLQREREGGRERERGRERVRRVIPAQRPAVRSEGERSGARGGWGKKEAERANGERERRDEQGGGSEERQSERGRKRWREREM